MFVLFSDYIGHYFYISMNTKNKSLPLQSVCYEATESKKLILKLVIPFKHDDHYNGEVLWTMPHVYRWLKAVLTGFEHMSISNLLLI